MNVTPLFIVSDNIIINKSLYSGRTKEEKEYRKKVKNEVIPNIIIELFRKEDF